MRIKFYCLIHIVAMLCCANVSHAQYGWKWGVSDELSTNSGFDTWAAAKDDEGNILVSGFTAYTASAYNYIVYGTDTIYNPAAHQQQILIKLDTNGHFLWAKGTEHSTVMPLSLAADHNGNIYVFGYYCDSLYCNFDSIRLYNTNLYMFYVAKYSPAGNVLWAKNVNANSSHYNYGSIGIDSANNVYITGSFDSATLTIGTTTLINHATGTNFDIYVAKFDSSGTPLWVKDFGGTGDDYPTCMTVTNAGNCYLSGMYNSNTMTVGSTLLTDSLISGSYTTYLSFIIKLNNSGNVIWAKKQSKELNPTNIVSNNLENIYMVGYFDSSLILGPDTINSISGMDAFVTKFDSSGNFKWAKSAGGAYADYAYSVGLDSCNNVWIAGGVNSIGYIGTYYLHFGADSMPVPTGPDPAFMAEFNDCGNYITSIYLPTGGDDMISILPDKKGSFYLASDYFDSSLIFGHDTLGVMVPNQEVLFVAKYKYSNSCTFVSCSTVRDGI